MQQLSFLPNEEEPCNEGSQEDYADVLERPNPGKYDARFDYTENGPQWNDPCLKKRWLALRKRLFKAQDGVCHYCGQPLAYRDMHLDHRQPVSRGGSHHISNLCATCSTCNLEKGALTEQQYFEHYWPKYATKAQEPIPEQFIVKPAPSPAKVEGDFVAGRRVHHSTFGTGVIVSAKERGNDTEVVVVFENGGVKRLSANFAKLKFIE